MTVISTEEKARNITFHTSQFLTDFAAKPRDCYDKKLVQRCNNESQCTCTLLPVRLQGLHHDMVLVDSKTPTHANPNTVPAHTTEQPGPQRATYF